MDVGRRMVICALNVNAAHGRLFASVLTHEVESP